MAGISLGMDARLVRRGLGVSTYIRQLTAALLERDDVERIVWFGSEGEAPRHARLQTLRAPRPFAALDLRPGVATRAGIDVMHFPAVIGWTRRGPVPHVQTLHDLDFLENRGTGARQQLGRRYMSFVARRCASSAAGVITGSRAACDEIVDAGWTARPPTVVHHGVVTTASPRPTAERSGFVAFAGLDPRKDTLAAVRGFLAARPQLDAAHGLVLLAGAGMPSEAARLVRGRDDVEVLPYVDRVEVEQRLAGAVALLHPSRAEGFGLPAIEAMALGTPVIGGLNAAAREVGGDALIRLDPQRVVESMAAEMAGLASDAARLAEASAVSLAHAGQFTWAASAQAHMHVFLQALGR